MNSRIHFGLSRTAGVTFEKISSMKAAAWSAAILLWMGLTCVFSNSLHAQVSMLQDWTNVYHGSSSTAQTATVSIPTGSNSYRLLVVAIASSRTTSGSVSATISYGGRSLTSAGGDFNSTGIQQHTSFYYLKESDIDLAGSSTLSVAVSGGTIRVNDYWVAIFDYVNQTTPIADNKNANNSATTNTITLATSLSINAGNFPAMVVSSFRSANATPRTITAYPTNFTMTNEQTWTTTDGVRNGVADATIPTSNTTNACTTTFSGNCWPSLTAIAIASACTQASANAGSALSAICKGGTSAALGGSTGGSATGGTWSDGGAGGSFSPNATTLNATYTPASSFTGTVTLTLTSSGGSCGTATASKTLVVNPVPTAVTASSSASAVCSGGSVNLTSSATSNSGTAVTLINENFNAATNSWVKTNNTTGGTATTNAAAAWVLFASGTSHGSTTPEVITSNDNSQFYFSSSDSTGAATVTTNTILESPSFSTAGLSAASLSFYHYYKDFDANDSIRVLISTDGGTNWTRIYLSAATVGAANAFANQVISLNSYLGFANVKLRFQYSAKWGWFWNIDNVSVTGTLSAAPAATFAWTSSPAGFTSAVQNPTGVTVSASTVYTVTATNSYGCTATATASVTANALPSAPTGTNGSRCGTGTVSISAAAGAGETIDWYAAATGGSALLSGNTNYTTPSISATTTYYAQARNTTTGCLSATRTPVTATVASSPTIADQSSSSVYGAAATYTIVATGATSYTATSTLPAGFTLNTTTGVISVASTVVPGTYSISLTATNTAGCISSPPITLTYTRNTATLAITGLTGNNKVYDRTTAATASGTAALSGIVGSDVVSISGTPTFTFASANVGTAISISTSGYSLTGANAGNYSLTQPTLSANITAKALTLSGVTANNKVYDATTTATAAGTLTLSGVISPDVATLSGTAAYAFASANVGTAIAVNTSGLSLTGANAGNYSLTQPSLSANITPKSLTITANNAVKCYGYDYTFVSTAFTSSGLVSPQTIGSVTLTSAGASAAADLGAYSIVASAATGGTFSASNYSITYANGTLTVSDVPLVSGDPSSSDVSYCLNATAATLSVTATAGSGTISGYQWYKNTVSSSFGGTLIAGATSATYTPPTNVAGDSYYYCVVTNSNGCYIESNPSGKITVNALPTVVTVSGGGSVCNNTILTASNGSSGTIYFQGTTSGGTSTATASSSQLISTSGTYYFRAKSAAGCWGPEGSAVVTLTAPVVTSVEICQGGSGSFSAIATCNAVTGQVAGPSNATSGVNTTGIGTAAWTSPGNAISNDNNNATATVNNATSNYLRTTGYGFNLASDAVIGGIVVTIGRFQSATGAGNDVRDVEVRLLKAGALAGSNYAATTTEWPTAEAAASYGTGTTDLWGTTWTAADINASNFGVSLYVNSANNRTASVDYMQVTVYYSLPGNLNWYTASSGGTFLGTGATFNPVGVAGSGLSNTNTAGTTAYYVECSRNAGCRGAGTFKINANNPASVVITSSDADNTICAGESVTFTATPTNGGTAPAYQWKKNNVNISGATSDTYTTTGLANGDAITVVMTSNLTPCVTLSPATSNSITTTVNPYVNPSVTISSNAPGNISCPGANVVFTATPTNGGTSPTYQWKLNGNNVGTNSATYSSTSIVNGDVISVDIISNASCLNTSSATSNSITMEIDPDLVAAVTITSSDNDNLICAGTSVTFTAVGENGGTAPIYQWKKNGVNVGTNSTTYTTTSLADGDVITCVFTSNYLCISGSPATSNAITTTVNTTVAPTGTNGSRCGTGTVDISATASGSTIDWYSAATGGTLLLSGSDNFTTPSIAATTIYYAEAINTITGCSSLTRTAVTATVNAVPAAPTGTSASRCGTGTVALSATVAGGVTVDWYDAASGGTLLATGSTSFTTPSLSATAIYYAEARNATTGCLSVSRTAFTATINEVPTVASSTDGSRCGTGTVVLGATASAGATIDWYAAASGGTVLTGGTGVTSFTTPSIAATTTYYAQARNTTTSCISSSRTAVVATINAIPTTVSVSGGGTLCATSTTLTASNGSSGTIYYQGTTSGGTSTADTSTSVLINTNGTYYFRAQSAAGCWSTQGSATVTLQMPVVTGVEICQGTASSALTATFSCSPLANQTTGPNDATAGANVSGVGTITWSTPANITTTGTAGASVTASSITNYLQGTNYGFNIPSDATINGITVSISRSTSGTNSPLLRDNVVSLVKGGVIQTVSNKAVTGTNWPGTLTAASYGSTTDLWSNTWTPADINASNFGVVLSASNTNTASTRTAAVDYMRITVTYTTSGNLNWYTASSGGSIIATGSSFNPVGVANSGLANTNTAGTTSYYVACAATPACRATTTFKINPSVPASVSISSSDADNKICAGNSVTFTATPTNGGSAPAYQWKKNNVDVTGETASTFTTSGLVDGDAVSVVMTSNSTETCLTQSPATSNSITTVVNQATASTTTISACDSYSWNGNNYTSSGSYTFNTTNANGCDSTAVLNLTITASTSSTTTVSACDSYTWSLNNQTYTSSGNYSVVTGCHTEYLNLTVTASTTHTNAVTACDSYTWSENSQTYTASGSYTVVTGCHTEILNLTVYTTSSNTTTISVCDSYTWSVNGQTYTASGSYTDVNNCATEILNLTVTASTSNTTTESVCDSYTWSVNGLTYTNSGNYSVVTGCHTEYLNLTVTASTTHINAVTAGGSYTWSENSVTYTESGSYTAVTGCHTEILNLTIVPLTRDTTTVSACDTYTWSVNGQTYTASGTYTHVVGYNTSVLELTVTASTSNTSNVSVCDSYIWSVNGQTYTASGSYTDVDNCHTEILNLTITSSSSNTTTASACDSYVWSVNGQTYTASGSYTDVTNCRTEILNLTVTASTTHSNTVSVCDSYTWAENGQTYTASGTYSAVTGCHTEVLNLTVTPSSSNTSTVNACDSYTWSVNGQTYTVSGSYTDVDNCHTEILDLTITASTSNTSSATACTQYTWAVNGQTYTASGTYSAVTGCHTEVLNLTVTPSTSNTSIVNACDSYTWSVNGQTYTASGSYTDVDNCHTEILDLTITASTSNTSSAAACTQYTWAVNGQTYTSSGVYTSVANCHTEILNLTITAPVTTDLTASGCGSYVWNGNTYVSSGNYTSRYTAANGCDSIVTLHLTVNPLPAIPGAITGITEVCSVIGLSTPATYSIAAVAGAASYNWILPAGATIATGSGTNSIGVTFTNTLASTNQQIRVASVSAEGCQSITTSFITLTKTLPGIPTISGPTNACPYVGAGNAVYTCDSIPGASSYSWTVPAGASIASGQGTRSIQVTFTASFTSGAVTVAAVANCGSRSPRSFSVARLLPTAPAAILGPVSACPYLGNGVQATYSVAAVANATSYTWTVPSTVTIVSGQGTNSIVVTFAGNFVTSNIKVRSNSNCFTTGDRQLLVTAATYAGPGSITGPTNACYFVNNDANAVYTIRKVANVPNYIWTVPTGATIVSHPGGTGANDTSIVVSFNSNFVFGSQILVQTAGCGASAPRSITITGTLVSMPGNISGPTNACEFMVSGPRPNGLIATYKIPKSTAATYYTWTAPANATIISHPGGTGVNDTIVEVKFNDDFVSGSLKVKAGNSCGSSNDRTLTISKLNPATPAVFDVIQVSNCPARVYTYTLASMPLNATSVVWTVPDGATILSGQGTTSISVSYPPSVVSGYVTAQSFNNCSSSSLRSRQIKLQSCPNTIVSTSPTGKTPVAITEDMTVTVYPNPTTTEFRINLNTQSAEPVKVKVMDMQGRMIKYYTIAASQQMSFGNDLKAGSYMVEFIQGDKKKVQRLMKF